MNTDPTTIVIDIPDCDPSRDNIAEVGTEAWLAEARDQGVDAVEIDCDWIESPDYGTLAGAVEVNGKRYVLSFEGASHTIVAR